MRLCYRSIVLVLVACAWHAPRVQAQPFPDTTEAWRYFPLEVGNTWEYTYAYDFFSVIDTLGFRRWTVTGTEDVDGRRYQVVQEEWFDPDGAYLPDSSGSVLVRFDTLSARLLARDSAGVERGWPPNFPGCPLDAAFGDTASCDDGERARTGGGSMFSVGNQQLQGLLKTYDIIAMFSLPPYRFWFAADVGLIRYQEGASFQVYHYLRAEYVRTGGVEYGAPLPVAAEPSAEVPHALRLEQNVPNPARGVTTIPFSLNAPTSVRLTVYDLLGREEVRLLDESRAAGRHRVRLNASMLPAGVYVYRLESEGEVATRMLAIVR